MTATPPPSGPHRHTTGALAQALGAELVGPADLQLTGLDTLDNAAPGALTFIRSKEYAARWASSRAAAALVTRGIPVPGHDPAARALLIVDDADLALIRVLETLAPPPPPPAGVHPTAAIDPTATLGAAVTVGPHCTVGARASIGDGTRLGPGVVVGDDVRIGRGCALAANAVVLDRCVLGDGCVLHPGVVIGADGFGYRPAPDGRGVIKIPHLGIVVLEDGVEIGANTCIDRAKFGATRIGAGTKIDNLVQIGHGVQIGRVCLLAGQVGIGGSSVVGDGVMMGGQAGIADNLKVGPGAKLAAKTGVLSDLPAGEAVFGTPALPVRMALRAHAILRQMASGRGRSRGEPRRDAGASS